MVIPPEQASVGRPPGVTVVIPTYNYGRFLPAAIESALGQSYQPLDVLVVDDGSTDETQSIVRSYGNHVRCVTQPNRGLSAARNTGIAESAGPLLVFLDSDDVLRPEMVEKMVATLQSLPESFGLIACQTAPIDAEGRLIKRKVRTPNPEAEITADDLILVNHFSPAVLVRKRVLDEVGGFNTTLKSSEDRDMWIRIAEKSRIYCLSGELALKRVHGSNMSSNAERQSENMRVVLWGAFSRSVVSRVAVTFWLRVSAMYLYQSALMYHDGGSRWQALRRMMCSLLVWPFAIRASKLNLPCLFRLRSLGRIVLSR